MSNFHSPLSKKHKQIVAALCATYGMLYLGRVNISVVLPVLAVELDVSRAEIGILGTVFFWTYAIGNFVNGEIGSHVSPKRVVGLGLLVTAFVNLVFGFQTSLLLMLVLWGLNGFAQSGGWPPIVKHFVRAPASEPDKAGIDHYPNQLCYRHGGHLDHDRGSGGRRELAPGILAAGSDSAVGGGALVEGGH